MRLLQILGLWLLLSGVAGGQLVLPGKRPLRTQPRANHTATGGAMLRGSRAPLQLPSRVTPSGGALSDTVDPLGQVASTDGVDPPPAGEAARDVSPGLEAARRELLGDQPVRLVSAFRILIDQGTEEDRERVLERLRTRVPARAAGKLLAALLHSDPMLATPGYLVELLDHPTGALRQAALRRVEQRGDAGWIPLFVALYQTGRPPARLLVLDLVARLRDPAALRLLAEALCDARADVAARAAEHLALWNESEALPLLRRAAFGEDAGGKGPRAAGYALLSLVLRELRDGSNLLDDEDVPALLEGLHSGQPLLAGASAAALAGVGFRAPLFVESSWLDDVVPDTLVRLATGYEYHVDYSSLRGPGLRRLALISGMSHGADGYRWQAWWAEHAVGFRARRAILALSKDDQTRLRVFYQPLADADLVPFELCGPAVASVHVEAPAGEALFLTDGQAVELLGLLQAEGVFGAERLPSQGGALRGDARRIAVRVGAAEKVFDVRRGIELAWFERVEAALIERARSLSWQRWFDPEVHASAYDCYVTERHWWASEPLGFYLGRKEWWQLDASDGARRGRLKSRILRRLAERDPGERERGLAELERLESEYGVFAEADFAALLGLLEDEEDYGTRFSPNPDARARRLVRLLIAAGRAPSSAGPGAARSMRPALARALLGFLIENHGDAARDDLERILAQAGTEALHAAARAPEALWRSISARGIGERLARAQAGEALGAGDATDRELLLGLLADEDPGVVLHAVTIAGEYALEVARARLVRKARHADPRCRAAALRALGKLGGEGVAELCVLALAETDAELERAAVEGLADLRDPQSAALLASLFARGSGAAVFADARRGLVALGREAWPELLRLTASKSPSTRRAAALLLAEDAVPQAASVLITALTLDGEDQRVARELAILTCVDLRAEEDPARAWWDWWDVVVHDDAHAWLLAAGARAGLEPPPSSALEGRGTARGVRFLLELSTHERAHLRERARRELSRLLQRPVAPAPSQAAARARWRAELERALEEVFGA